MATKKKPLVNKQEVVQYYLATDWSENTADESFDSYYSAVGNTVEKAVSAYKEEMERCSRFVYVISSVLKAKTTYQ